MIPHTDGALRMLSQRLMTQLLPDLSSEYSMGDGLMIGLLMNAIADEMEEGIQRRLTDIDEMQLICRNFKEHLQQDEIDAVAGKLLSYRLADVNRLHDALTRVLIALQARCEETVDMARVQAAIWLYLRRHAERHVITAVP
jgi:hypothetical protein